MERNDLDLLHEVSKSNVQLKRLYEEHLRLEGELEEYKNRNYLTPQEEMEEKKLKIEKAQGMTQILQILSQHRH